MKLLLLPGMDGTGELFAPFVAEVSSWASTRVVRYPTHLCLSVDALVDRIELDAPVTVIAESFSGAAGIRLAAKHPALVKQLVLVGSFVTPPFGSAALRLLGPMLFQVTPPSWALRKWMCGEDASDEFAKHLSRTLTLVAPEVLAHRLASISRLDERDRLKGLKVPVITLCARHDRLISGRQTAELRSLLPNARHLDLDGPHLLLQARPREAAALLATALR